MAENNYLANRDYQSILAADIENNKTVDDIEFYYGLDVLDDQFGGIYPNEYMVWTGKSGTGKSTIVYDKILFSILDQLYNSVKGILKIEGLSVSEFMTKKQNKDNTIKKIDSLITTYIKTSVYLRFFSLEISTVMILHKLLVRQIYYLPESSKYKGILETKYTRGRLIPKNQKEELLSHVSTVMNTPMFKLKMLILKAILYLEEDTTNTGVIIDVIKQDEKKIDMLEEKYGVMNKIFYILFFDHIGLSTGDKEFENIGVLSKEFVQLRKRRKASVHLIQQTNPSSESKKDFKFMVPNYEDLRGNKSTYQDADGVISLASPYNEGYDSIPYRNGVYMINPFAPQNESFGLTDHLIIGKINKDRNGTSNVSIAIGFIGRVGIMQNILKPDEFGSKEKEINMYEYYMNMIPSYNNPESIYYIKK